MSTMSSDLYFGVKKTIFTAKKRNPVKTFVPLTLSLMTEDEKNGPGQIHRLCKIQVDFSNESGKICFKSLTCARSSAG